METIKPTISERATGALIPVSGGTLVVVLSKIYEYQARAGTNLWVYLLLHLRLWFMIFVPILALVGSTVVAGSIAARRTR